MAIVGSSISTKHISSISNVLRWSSGLRAMNFAHVFGLVALLLSLVSGNDNSSPKSSCNRELCDQLADLKSILVIDPSAESQVAFFIQSNLFTIEMEDVQKAKCVEAGTQANIDQLISCVSLYLFRDPDKDKVGTYFCRQASGGKWSFFNMAQYRIDNQEFPYQQTDSEYVITYAKDSSEPRALEFIQPDLCRVFKWYIDENPGKVQSSFGFYRISRLNQRLIFCEQEFAKQPANQASCRPTGVMKIAFRNPPLGFVYNKSLYLFDLETVLVMDATKLFTATSGDKLIEIEYRTIRLQSMFGCDGRIKFLLLIPVMIIIAIILTIIVFLNCLRKTKQINLVRPKVAKKNIPFRSIQSLVSSSTDDVKSSLSTFTTTTTATNKKTKKKPKKIERKKAAMAYFFPNSSI